jgi:uncharacterized membrane protein YfbV (UPF0208 family)
MKKIPVLAVLTLVVSMILMLGSIGATLVSIGGIKQTILNGQTKLGLLETKIETKASTADITTKLAELQAAIAMIADKKIDKELYFALQKESADKLTRVFDLLLTIQRDLTLHIRDTSLGHTSKKE